MTPEASRLLRELIHDHCGVSFGEDMEYLLERRLRPRLEHHGLSDYMAYYQLLRGDPARRSELDTAVEVLTTHETYFYREPKQLQAFADVVLPELARQNAGQRRLRIWSAGCSTGEEAYTIAIVVDRSQLFQGWEVEVVGSDIAQRTLEVAREGVFGPNAFRTPEAEALWPWFRAEGGRWRVRARVRHLVTFARANLLEGRPPFFGEVDVVFCRNVLIYFGHEARRRVLQSFREKLRPGGYLLLGHSESLSSSSAGFEDVQLRDAVVHRKRGAAP